MTRLDVSRAWLFAALFFALGGAFAQDLIAVPERRIVTDLSGTLSEQQQNALTRSEERRVGKECA